MKKNKYLFLLRNKLLWKHSTRDINSIIFDYNEYFNIGLSNGKSENDMVADLGSPSDVAKALEDERSVSAPIKLLVRLGLGFMLILYTYIHLINIYSNINIIGISLVFTILTPIGIWLLVGGDLRYKHIDNAKLSLNNFKPLIIVLIVYLLTAIINSILILYSAEYILTNFKLPFGLPVSSARLYFVPLFHFSSVIGAISIIGIVHYYRRTFLNTLPLLFTVVGGIYSVQSLVNKYSQASVPEDLFSSNSLWLCMTPLLLGLTATVLSFNFVKILDKRGQ